MIYAMKFAKPIIESWDLDWIQLKSAIKFANKLTFYMLRIIVGDILST